MQVNKLMVQETLLNFLNLFPEAGYSHDTLEHLVDTWLEDMRDNKVQGEEFVCAAKMARQDCLYFPKPKNVLDAVREIREERIRLFHANSARLALPEQAPLTDEQVARNVKASRLMAELCDPQADRARIIHELTQLMPFLDVEKLLQ